MIKILEVAGFCLFMFSMFMIIGILCARADNHCNSITKDYWEYRQCMGI